MKIPWDTNYGIINKNIPFIVVIDALMLDRNYCEMCMEQTKQEALLKRKGNLSNQKFTWDDY